MVIAQEGSKTVQEEIKLAQSSLEAFDAISGITKVSFEGAEKRGVAECAQTKCGC